jgi:nitrogen fixation protein FixH
MPSEPAKQKRSPWPWAIVAGLGVVFLANGIMLYLANKHAPVIETTNYYEKAVDHQTVIDARAASATLGWSAEISGDGQEVRYVLKDAAGQPVTGLTGAVMFRRNETNTMDRPAPIVASQPTGTYTVTPPSSKAGIWRLEARFEGGAVPWLNESMLTF